MDEIFAETSKETVKELSLLSLSGASADPVTNDVSHSSSACSSDMDFFDSWYYDDSASDTVLLEHGADFCEDVYRIVENETQTISGPIAWPLPTSQPLHTKRKGRLSRFLAKFKVRRQREKNKFGGLTSRAKEKEHGCLPIDRRFDPEQTEICGGKRVVTESRCDDVIIPVFHSDNLHSPDIITEPDTDTCISKSIVCQGSCHMRCVSVYTGEVTLTANAGRSCHMTSSELTTTVESMVDPRDKAVKRAESLCMGASRPDGTSHNERSLFKHL